MLKRDQEHGINRRDLLKVIGTSAAAIAAASSRVHAAQTLADKTNKSNAVAGLQARARKNIKLGIMSGVYAGLPLEEAARRIKEDGFSGVVLQPDFKDIHFDPANPDWDAAGKMTGAFEKNGIQVVGLFGYYNVVDPHVDRRKVGEQRIDLLIKNWKRFGCPIISTETGTFNPTSEWEEDPRNLTEEGYQADLEVFTRLARAAEKTKAVIAIECYWKNVIGSAERAERLLKDVHSTALKITMDPSNYFRNQDLPRMDFILEDMFKRLGSDIVIAHAKDVKAAGQDQDLPAAGRGVLNYPLYLRLLTDLNREMFLIIEHLTLPDVPRARDFVKRQIEKL